MVSENTEKISPVRFSLDPFDRPDGEVVRFTMYREVIELQSDRALPFGYRLEPWTEQMLPVFAAVLAVAFSDSPDLDYYPKLASKDGCVEILNEIGKSTGFLPGASWLTLFNKEPAAIVLASRAVQGLMSRVNIVAVAPRHRRVKVGTHLLNKAMWAVRDRRIPGMMLRINRNNRDRVDNTLVIKNLAHLLFNSSYFHSVFSFSFSVLRLLTSS